MGPVILTLSVPPSTLSRSARSRLLKVSFFSLFVTVLDMALRLQLLELATENYLVDAR